MKKNFTLLTIACALAFAACDKIAPEEYTIYDGTTIIWTSSNETPDPTQRVYVEKYTGPKCSNCPLADETLATIHDSRVVILSVNHPTGQGEPFPNQPDMRTDGGNAWDSYFGINAIPAAYINRDRSTQYQGSMSNITSAINQALTASPTIAVSDSAVSLSGPVDIFINLQFLKEHKDPLTCTVALVEDSLAYKQLLPDGTIDPSYLHHHMLRKVITGFWGRDIETSGTEGTCLLGHLSFEPDADINLSNSHIVVFISDKASRQVLNCASCKIITNE